MIDPVTKRDEVDWQREAREMAKWRRDNGRRHECECFCPSREKVRCVMNGWVALHSHSPQTPQCPPSRKSSRQRVKSSQVKSSHQQQWPHLATPCAPVILHLHALLGRHACAERRAGAGWGGSEWRGTSGGQGWRGRWAGTAVKVAGHLLCWLGPCLITHAHIHTPSPQPPQQTTTTQPTTTHLRGSVRR